MRPKRRKRTRVASGASPAYGFGAPAPDPAWSLKGHGLYQFVGLALQTTGRAMFPRLKPRFARGLIQLADGSPTRCHAATVHCGGADFSHDVGHALDGGTHRFAHGGVLACRPAQCRALPGSTPWLMRGFDFLGGLGRCARPGHALREATTAKPRPCSPARAASTAAFQGPGCWSGRRYRR